MELKNAVAVCLISLFSATLVVMIARSLDSQAATRIEPQLAAIVDELQAIRKQGGIGVAPGGADAAKSEAIGDGLMIYYFHSNARCVDCVEMESQSHETVRKDFAAALERGTIVWKVLNYQRPTGERLAKEFSIDSPTVVLVKMKGGQVQDWRKLNQLRALLGDKPAFADLLRSEIKRMQGAGRDAAPPAAVRDETTKAPPADLPVPK